MICDNCIKKDVCVHLLKLKEVDHNIVSLGINSCTSYYAINSKKENNTVKFKRKEDNTRACDICGKATRFNDTYVCKKCGKIICGNCAYETEYEDDTMLVTCYECAEEEEEKKDELDEFLKDVF